MNQYSIGMVIPMLVLLLRSIYKNNQNKKKLGKLLYEYHLVANLNLAYVFIILFIWAIVLKDGLKSSHRSELTLFIISVEYFLLLGGSLYKSFNRPSFYEHGILHYKHHIKWDYIRGYEFKDSRFSRNKLLTLRIIASTEEGKMDFDMDYRFDEDTFEDVLSLLISNGVGPVDKERLIV